MDEKISSCSLHPSLSKGSHLPKGNAARILVTIEETKHPNPTSWPASPLISIQACNSLSDLWGIHFLTQTSIINSILPECPNYPNDQVSSPPLSGKGFRPTRVSPLIFIDSYSPTSVPTFELLAPEKPLPDHPLSKSPAFWTHLSHCNMASSANDASSLLFDFGNGVSNTVNFDENYDEESDGTLLGEDFEEQFVRPTPDQAFNRSEPIASAMENQRRLDSFSSNGRTYRPGKTVELVDGDFLRITAILPHRNPQAVLLEGLRFRRNKQLEGLLEFKRNEVTMLLNMDDEDARDIYHQSIHTVELAEVVRMRELVKTNQLFPALSYRESDPGLRSQSKDYVMQFGRIVCRTKLVQANKNQGCLQFLEEAETDERCAGDPHQLRCDFRGETEKGGSCPRWLNGEEEFDEVERERSRNIDILRFHHDLQPTTTARSMTDLTGDGLDKSRRYTLGDAFCGAGGASRGAKAAGLRIDWGFDFDPAAIDSYRKNFHRARCEAIAAHDFVTVINEDFQVDILHLSPPCQTFSPYHVHTGKNDELNQATFFAIEGLLMQIKPRIVTLEETFGLTTLLKHQEWFRSMIQTFSRLGFSVRWKVFKLCDFGLPQPRKRLFLLASW